MSALVTVLGWRGIAILALAGLVVWYRDQVDELASSLDRATERAERLAGEVREGNDAMAAWESANASQLETLRECHAYAGDLARESRRLEEAFAAVRAAASERLQERDAANAELAARPTDARPSVTEANAIMQERGAGWLWR
ncbi:MAG: hypothetical protein RLW61_14360 [Gammaproteobacteria bacterium]